MTPAEVLHEAQAAGLAVTVAPSGNLFAKPVERLTPELRALLIGHKAELLKHLRRLPAANDAAPDLTGWKATLAPGIPPETVAKFKAASEALDRQIAEVGAAADPDRDCWPSGPAMNTGEIEHFAARMELFRRRSLSADLAESIADKLLRRDREGDDRRLCLECVNLSGRRCTAWQQAGIGDPDVSSLRTKLQRCDAFRDGDDREDQNPAH